MSYSTSSIRLQQLEDNVVRIFNLLNEYEIEIVDEPDPGVRSKYHRRISSLKRQRDAYELELDSIQSQLASTETQLNAASITNQLQQIDSRITQLSQNQIVWYETVLSYFCTEEKPVVESIARQLEESQIIEVESVLDVIDSNEVAEEDVKAVVVYLQEAIALMKSKNINLPSGNEEILSVLNHSTVESKHALKLSVPIIPFVLTYEGELGLGTGANLREVWTRWKNKRLSRE